MVPLLFRSKQDIGAGVGGVAQAGASVIDTAATNAANIEMQQRANTFNAQQAAMNRSFQNTEMLKQQQFGAGQAALTRSYQTGERESAQAYNTAMSNTAIQRRVTDLKAAGINPLLAATNLGGASSPISSGMSGATAASGLPGGSQASAAPSPRLEGLTQNLANLRLTSAQAANVVADTQNKKDQNVIIEAMGDQWKVDTSPEMLLKRVQAVGAQYDLDYAKASEVEAAVGIIRNAKTQGDVNIAGGRLQNAFQSMENDVLKATMGKLIDMQNAVSTQQAQEAQNITAAQSGLLGKAIAYAQAILTPVSSAAGAAQKGASAAKDLVGWGGAIP